MIAVLVVVVLAGSRDGAISTKYVVLFLCLLAVILIGLASNSTTAGSLIVGIRNYLKFLPFFFLPAVFLFDEKQVSSQLKLLLAFVLLQGPLALYQKFIQFGVTSFWRSCLGNTADWWTAPDFADRRHGDSDRILPAATG